MAKRQPGSTSATNHRELAVDVLLLDDGNPRLPENLVSKGKRAEIQAEILEYFRIHGNLDELARSFADNGYFKTEPLIVTKEGAPAGRYVVLEGNRRLAALQLMLGASPRQLSELDVSVNATLRAALEKVPVLEVTSRSDATAMIGFRHIGGLKYWDSDAKARWISRHVEESSSRDDPFGHIARMVGMPRSQIRYYYLAAGLVQVAREELKYDTRNLVDQDRFGVFLRAVENPGIRKFIGLDDVSGYREARRALMKTRRTAKNLVQVLNDIASREPTGKFVVGDSRNIPKYGRVLDNPEALKVLRRDSLEAALAVLAPITLTDEVRKTSRQLQRLRDKLDSEDTLSREVIHDLHSIQRIAQSLRTTN